MRIILYLSFLIVNVFCFGQQSYQFTDGELEFVNKNTGIIVKKGNELYRLKIRFPEKISDSVQFLTEKIDRDILKTLTGKDDVFYSSYIISYDFGKIKNIVFTTKKDDEIQRFFALNNEIFIQTSTENDRTKPKSSHLYFILEFKNNKKILCFQNFEYGLIVPVKGKSELLVFGNDFNNYKTGRTNKLKASEIFTGWYSNVARSYFTDILTNKKVVYRSVFGNNVLDDSYDSIFTNRQFVVAYKNKEISIYNYRFQKFPLKNIRAVHTDKYFAYAQILQKNKIRKINLLGQDYKLGDGPEFMNFSHMFPDQEIRLEINKTRDGFYLKSSGGGFGYNDGLSKDTLFYHFENQITGKLHHSEEYDSIRFAGFGIESITISSETGYEKKYPIIFYCKRKDGKYDLNTIEYLLLENPPEEIVRANNDLPKFLDKVIPIDQDTYRIEKNGLATYFPIIKEIKYRKLEKFDLNFARFMLPNGKKGWLDKNGVEYLDE